jgi:phage terminase large subunit
MFQLNPNLKTFWRTRKPYKILKGGRFSSKTQDAAGMAAFLARNYSLKFLCIRQFQNRIADSVYVVIREKIEQAGWLDEFDIGVSSIRHKTTGSEFLFYGMARNIEEIKGTEGVDICWVEEGEGLSEKQWSIIDPTIRREGSEIWILYNPRLITDFVETKLPKILGDDCVIKHINYHDNPFLSETARRKAERLKDVDPDEYNHIYLGIPIADNELAIIKRSWIESAVDAHIKLGIDMSGHKKSALDVADLGADSNAQSLVEGVILRHVIEWRGKSVEDIFGTTQEAFNNSITWGCNGFRYDADGIGAGVRGDARVINEDRERQYLPKLEVSAFHGSGAVIDKGDYFLEPDGDMQGVTNGAYFKNYKAQSWWSLRERFRKTLEFVSGRATYDADELISLDSSMSNIEQIKTELAQPRKKAGSSKMVVDKQPDGMPSPNLADAVMMAYAPIETTAAPAVFGGRRHRR